MYTKSVEDPFGQFSSLYFFQVVKCILDRLSMAISNHTASIIAFQNYTSIFIARSFDDGDMVLRVSQIQV